MTKRGESRAATKTGGNGCGNAIVASGGCDTLPTDGACAKKSQ